MGVWRMVLAAVLIVGCDASDDSDSEDGRVDGAVGRDGGTGPGDAASIPLPDGATRPLSLSLAVTDGACADLAITGRSEPAVRFTITGRPGAPVELWAAKPGCDVAPFVYQDAALDDAGRWTLDLRHGGGATCTDNLLGTWEVWAVMDGAETARQPLTFASADCAEAASCASADTFCPAPADEPLLPKGSIFVLSDRERTLFTPPDPSWLEWRTRYEDFPLRALYEAFDEGRAPEPMPEDGGEAGWLEPDGGGSRNHGPLWMGQSALGHAFQENPARFDVAAENCITILELDDLQGHMRDESVGGYAGFWEGAIASMALAALYAPEGSTMGPALLAKARAWWDDHIATLRRLSTDDGQVMLVGARTPSVPGETDSWSGLSAALNLQLVDPKPHDQLHPTLASLITADGEPAAGMGGVPIRWYRPRHVAERWVMLRAVQSGAIRNPPALEPGPDLLAQTIYRWEAGGRTHVATPEVRGLGPCRWKMSWAPGQVVRIDVGNTADTAAGGRGPHPAPEPLGIPAGTSPILGAP